MLFVSDAGYDNTVRKLEGKKTLQLEVQLHDNALATALGC
jgi:hypothetical protein